MSLRNLKIILQNSILVSKNKPLKFKNQIKKLERLPRIFKKKDSAPIKEVENLMINKEKEILLNETSTFPKIKITLLIDDFRIETQALIDPTIYSNFIHEEIIPIKLLHIHHLPLVGLAVCPHARAALRATIPKVEKHIPLSQ